MLGGRFRDRYTHLSGKSPFKQYTNAYTSARTNAHINAYTSGHTSKAPPAYLEDEFPAVVGAQTVAGGLMHYLPAIRLKPEFEIYDFIFGKPDRIKKEKYEEDKIKHIEDCFYRERLPVDKIQERMAKKYNITII
jgi:hypothetical protein